MCLKSKVVQKNSTKLMGRSVAVMWLHRSGTTHYREPFMLPEVEQGIIKG